MMNCTRPKLFTGRQNGSWEIWFIGCIRKVLCLQTKSLIRVIHCTIFTGRFFHVNRSIELDSRLIRSYGHPTPRSTFRNAGKQNRFFRPLSRQHIIVIISTVSNLAVDSCAVSEIKLGAFHRFYLSRRNTVFVYGKIMIAIKPNKMTMHIPAVMASKVVVGMLS